jgi:hypothetical protein
MKAGFKVENKIEFYSKFIIVCNYHNLNTITNWGCLSIDSFKRDHTDIGVWKVKQLK